ncbi:undecaprenyl-diphosphatase UppP [Patescibacteria group bacterium]|nr:undecaprenyl-diphosphatase UppP [Patescibacteria group bacterium]
MTFFESILLGALQGITEFLPISSSGHLVVVESLLGLKVESLKSFDVFVHAGSLLAILIYFRKEISDLFSAFFSFFKKTTDNKQKNNQKAIIYLILGTIPATIIGLTLENQIDSYFRSVNSVAYVMILVAIFFVIAEYLGGRIQQKQNVKALSAIYIGLAQAIAIIPGVSRSGSTIATGLIGKLERTNAARFSFLLGSIAIFGALIITLSKDSFLSLNSSSLAIHLTGLSTSLIFSLLAINFLMKFLKKHSLNIFALYLIIIASLLLIFN